MEHVFDDVDIITFTDGRIGGEENFIARGDCPSTVRICPAAQAPDHAKSRKRQGKTNLAFLFSIHQWAMWTWIKAETIQKLLNKQFGSGQSMMKMLNRYVKAHTFFFCHHFLT